MARIITCEKHGAIDSTQVIKLIMWSRSFDESRWCLYCVNEMMNKFCGKVTITETEENKLQEKK